MERPTTGEEDKAKDDLWGQSCIHVRTEGVALLSGVAPGCWAWLIHEHKAAVEKRRVATRLGFSPLLCIYLLLAMLLAITALSTTFVGLLAILLLYGYRRKGVSHDDHARTLRQWLSRHNISLPSTAAVISAINKKAREEILRPTGEELKELRVKRLLPDTPLPVFTLLKLSSQSTDTMSIECSVEWPECAPGILVSAVKEKKTQHCIQVEVMKMKAAVELSVVDDQLMVSWQLLQRPELELTGTVTEEEDGDDDSMSDRVADAVSMLLTQFSIIRQQMTEEEEVEEEEKIEEPTNLRSTAEEEKEVGAEGREKLDEDLNVEVEEQDLIEVVQIRETVEQTDDVAEKKEEEEKENDSLASSKEHLLVPTKFVPTSSSLISNGTVCEDSSSERTSSAIAVHESSSDNLTNSWRRSPSYECLQEIGIDSESAAVQRVALSHSHDNISDNDSEKERLSTLSIRSYESILEDTIGSTPSTLVFEIQDGHHVLHQVATNVEQARQLRKQYPKSKKLHLYLSHTFMAVRIHRRQTCTVCKDKITGLIGKQAYQCRDCHAIAHKQCHYKVETTCTHSKVSSMNLIYPDGD